MPVQNACPACQGQKNVATPDGKMWQACPTCGGSGKDPGSEIPFDYVFDVAAAVFGANTVLTSVGVTTLGEADFVWKGFAATPATGWRVRFGFGGGGYMSSGGQGSTNDRVLAELIAGTGQWPVPIWPHVVVPRGGKLLFDLENLTNAGITLQFRFIGALLYPSA